MIPIGWPPPELELGPNDVHLWVARLDLSFTALKIYERTLSASELRLAQGYGFEYHRNRFIARRGFVRAVLSRYLRAEPAMLEFAHGPRGKPFLSGDFKGDLSFNWAHSGDRAILGVARQGDIGVDIERVRPFTGTSQIVNRYGSAGESRAFHYLPLDQRMAGFFNLWTRKEAWLKATGEGIGQQLNLVEVSCLPGESARFLSLPGGSQTTAAWVLRDVPICPGFAAALSVPAQNERALKITPIVVGPGLSLGFAWGR